MNEKCCPSSRAIRFLTYGSTDPVTTEKLQSLGLLFLRVSVGLIMLISHGWGKLMGFAANSSGFPDPLGVGNSTSMAMAIGAEVFCSIALVLGLATRLAAIPLIITMLVAAFIVHADDPWQKKEFALMYLFPYVTLLIAGAGKFSLDAMLSKKCTK